MSDTNSAQASCLRNVTRVEVINHSGVQDELGRVYGITASNIKVELSFQDHGRTLKVFILKRTP